MSNENEIQAECPMNETDSRGDTNLCCCYMIDENGEYEDPCYYPADECCGG